MKRATVIKLAGDSSLAGAIVEGMTVRELDAVRAENRRLNALNGVRREGDDRRWERTRRRLARKYSIKPVGRVRGAILGLWGLLWYKVFGVVRYMQRWNREG